MTAKSLVHAIVVIWTLTSCARRPASSARVSIPAVSALSLPLDNTVAPPHPAGIEAEPEREPEDEPEAALRFFIAKRAPDGKNIPVERLMAAKDHVKRMKRFSIAKGRVPDDLSVIPPSNTLPGAWTSVGPANVGGLTRGFVINPQNPDIMYAGASGGGVWETMDGGKTWTALADFVPTIAVNALTMDPSNPNVIYAGTGDNSNGLDAIRGLGIFKTTDGGQTWNQLAGTAEANFFYVFKIVVSPNQSNNVYAATSTGVWRSVDGGNTWSQTLARVAPNTGCQDLVIRTDQTTDYLFAACGTFTNPATAVFRTTDATGGSPWVPVLFVSGMGLTSLALAPSQQSTIYALLTDATPSSTHLYGMLGLYRSDSNGDVGTWTAKATQKDQNLVNVSLLSYPEKVFAAVCSNNTPAYNGQGYHDNALAVDPLNPERIWAGGIDTFRSDDGGSTWGIAMFWQAAAGIAAHADNQRLVFHPNYDGAANQILYNTSDGGIYMTNNANAAVATGTKAGCSPYPTSVVWQNLNNGYSVTQFYDGAVYPGANQYIAGAQDNGTLRGQDGLGTAWSSIRGGDGGFALINPRDPNVIFTDYVYLSLDLSTDGGNSNTNITSGITEPSSDFLFIAPVAMDPGVPQRIYIGGKALWRTDDQGSDWTQSTTNATSLEGQISAIAVSPADSNTVMYGTTGGYMFSSRQALSTDSTVTWNSSRPRSSGFVAQIAFDPTDPNTAYVVYSTYTLSGQHYVYKTSDGGMTWTALDGSRDSGLPDGPVHSIVVDPLNNLTLYVGTELGVFTSIDGGLTWMSDVNDFANTPITKLVLDRGAGVTQLVAFTYGRGVWKTQIPGTGTPCQYALSTTTLAMDPVGTDTPLSVQTADGCAWSVSPGTLSLYVESPAAQTGSGTAVVHSVWNVSNKPWTGQMAVADQMVTVTQAPALVVSKNDTNASLIPAVPYLGYEDTRKFTSDPADPAHSCTNSADFKTAWWTFTAPANGTAVISAQGERYDAFGNSGVVLTVYDTVRDAGAELACSVHPRDTTTWTPTTVQVPMTAGETYQIEISATGNTANDGGYTILAVVLNQSSGANAVAARKTSPSRRP